MRIEYPDDEPVFDGAQMVVRFSATVDGVLLVCAITAEALEDHFGARSPLPQDMLRAYHEGLKRIRSVCSRAIEANDGAAVVLRSGLFRMEDA